MPTAHTQVEAVRALARFWLACAERKQTPDGFGCWQDVGQAGHEILQTIEKASAP